MLSRTASNLYWIGRYMERAEFTARLLEATIRLSSLTRAIDPSADQSIWLSALAVAGETDAFNATLQIFSPAAVNRYLALAGTNPNSIRSCVRVARDNARAVRNAITKEAWEAINRAWLDIGSRTNSRPTQA